MTLKQHIQHTAEALGVDPHILAGELGKRLSTLNEVGIEAEDAVQDVAVAILSRPLAVTDGAYQRMAIRNGLRDRARALRQGRAVAATQQRAYRVRHAESLDAWRGDDRAVREPEAPAPPRDPVLLARLRRIWTRLSPRARAVLRDHVVWEQPMAALSRRWGISKAGGAYARERLLRAVRREVSRG